MIGFKKADKKAWLGNLRNVTSGDVLGRIDNVEVDWDREVSNSGGQVGIAVAGDEGFESRLLLADGVGSEIITTLATGSPWRKVVRPFNVERGGHYNSGERKEGGESDRETKEHGECERKTFRA